MQIAVLGIDLGNYLQRSGSGHGWRVVVRRRLRRESVIKFAAGLAPCIIAMEACCGAHHLGRILRTQSHVQQIPVFIDAFAALGANPVPLPFTELYTALETKAVDGQENPFVSVEITKFDEVQKFASNTRNAYSPLLVLASKRFWDRLSDDERKILVDAANEAKPYERDTSRLLDAKAAENLKVKGMVVTEISDEERERMRDRLKPVIDKHNKTISESLVQEVTAGIQKVRLTK